MFNLFNCSFQKKFTILPFREHSATPRGTRETSGFLKPRLTASELHRSSCRHSSTSRAWLCAALHQCLGFSRKYAEAAPVAWKQLKTQYGCSYGGNCHCWGEHTCWVTLTGSKQDTNRKQTGNRNRQDTGSRQEELLSPLAF